MYGLPNTTEVFFEEVRLVSGVQGRSDFWGESFTKTIWKEGGGYSGVLKGSKWVQRCYERVLGVFGGVRGCQRSEKVHFQLVGLCTVTQNLILSQNSETQRFGTIKNEILMVLGIKNPYFGIFCTVWEGFRWYFEMEVSLKNLTTFGMLFYPKYDSIRVLKRGSLWSQILRNRSPICPIGVGTNNSALYSI